MIRVAGVDWGFVVKKDGVIQEYKYEHSVVSKDFRIHFGRRGYLYKEFNLDLDFSQMDVDLSGAATHDLYRHNVCSALNSTYIVSRNIHGKLYKHYGEYQLYQRWITKFRSGGSDYEVLFGYGIPNNKSELKVMGRYGFSLKERIFVRRWFKK